MLLLCSNKFVPAYTMEGPSIIILKEAIAAFKGKKIIRVSGNSKIDQQRLLEQKVVDLKSWGKHFIIFFPSFSVRIHFLMFGSYRINGKKDSTPRLSLQFKTGELNFYTCAASLIEEDLNKVYDWEVDVMSEQWNPEKAIAALKKLKDTQICDALLDQQIFAGVGNIIKNEVLFVRIAFGTWLYRIQSFLQLTAIEAMKQVNDIDRIRMAQ